MGVSSIYRELIKTARRIDRKLETMGFSYLRKDIDETSGYFLGSYVPIEYVFFDGKEVRKIDNFPDSEFLNRNYDAYIENLHFLESVLLIMTGSKNIDVGNLLGNV